MAPQRSPTRIKVFYNAGYISKGRGLKSLKTALFVSTYTHEFCVALLEKITLSLTYRQYFYGFNYNAASYFSEC